MLACAAKVYHNKACVWRGDGSHGRVGRESVSSFRGGSYRDRWGRKDEKGLRVRVRRE